jgi:hypothetical protein
MLLESFEIIEWVDLAKIAGIDHRGLLAIWVLTAFLLSTASRLSAVGYSGAAFEKTWSPAGA